MSSTKYLIEETTYHGWIVYLRKTRGFGDPQMLVYHGPTIGDPNRFNIKGFILHTRLVADCSNLTCHFKTKEDALRAIEIYEKQEAKHGKA
jgi:hypothetical protein